MTLLPHWDEAILDFRKLEDYCLSHRTRVADTRLEYSDTRLGSSAATQPGCEMFCLKPRGPAKLLKFAADAWGTSWRFEISIERQRKSAMVRTIRIVRAGEEAPRFVTCWVL